MSVTKFELGEGDEEGQREARVLGQRQVCNLIERRLSQVERTGGS